MSILPASATLYLAAESPLVEDKVRLLAARWDSAPSHPFDGVWSLTLNDGNITAFSAAARGAFDKQELAATRCRMLGGEPTEAELMRSDTLGAFLDWIDGQWLGAMLAERRLTTHFQPIVCLQDPSRVFAYECLLRGIDGSELVSPLRLYEAARATGALDRLDAAARITAIQSAARAGVEANIFVNFCPRAIRQPQECLEETVWSAAASGIPAERFVFEVVESDEIEDVDQLVRILDYLRNAGCRVALDDLGAGYSSLNLLTRIKPDFVKLDMGLIRRVDTDQYKARVAGKLLELARDLHVKTVVEGVETPGELRWSQEHGADYAQGYLIARPAAVPPVSSLAPAGIALPVENYLPPTMFAGAR
jgi:EAL domain-containing protein (putative c-di-GMP-specific phosphodiesterase class I)